MMDKTTLRVLIIAAGTGSSGNLIRALRVVTPKPYIVGANADRFILKLSLADRNYLCPESTSEEFANTISEIVQRERINVIMPTDDNVVKSLSDGRNQLPIDLLLPRRDTIDLCQDKYALNAFLRERAIPVPRTFPIRSLRDLNKVFASFSDAGLLWCRARRGSRSLAAAPVATVEQARAWITQWRDLRGVKVSDFTLGEYLPGPHFIVQSIWHKGNLLRAQPIEVLSYFAAGNNPSGVFSLSCLAKTVVAPAALNIALRAVQALERRPSGAFVVELKESAEGTPSITEINAGRFPSGVTALLAIGRDNMVKSFAFAAVGQAVTATEPHGSALEYYLVRDIDAVPGVFSTTDLLEGLGRVAVPREPR
jgi:hypothetical protein